MTKELLYEEWKMAVVRDRLIIIVMVGKIIEAHCLDRKVGMDHDQN